MSNPTAATNTKQRWLRAILLCVPLMLGNSAFAQAKPDQVKPIITPSIDLVLALDVSGSMSGLINSAKQRLWDVVNELGQAQPTPLLRVAIVTYGSPSYGADTGYVKINQPLTTDLDEVNKTLFSFGTSGGDEFVARAIHTSLTQLAWSKAPNASKVLFVAGNESATQDPLFSLQTVAQQAKDQGLIINSIFCGTTQARDAASWAQVAQLGGGMYAAIDQQAGAIAMTSTPMDKQIAQLNGELNATYLAYGSQGAAAVSKQQAQDKNSRSMSEAALVSRTLTKAGKLYRNQSWDLIDALESGVELDTIATSDLPAPLQQLSSAEQQRFVEEKMVERKALKAEIGRLGQQRKDYIDAQTPTLETESLDTALKAGLQKAIEQQGLTLSAKP